MSYVEFHKFNSFVEALGTKEIDLKNDTIKIFLTNTQPLASHRVKGDIPEISAPAGYNYPIGGTDIQNNYVQSNGTGTLTGVPILWSDGPIGPFRYAVMYVDATTKWLVGWYDYGFEITTPNNPFSVIEVTFGSSILTVQ